MFFSVFNDYKKKFWSKKMSSTSIKYNSIVFSFKFLESNNTLVVSTTIYTDLMCEIIFFRINLKLLNHCGFN